jgi:hypothetical protein
MYGRYTMGGHEGPSDMIPPDTGGVEMRAPEALPFNRAPGRETRVAYAAADDWAVRRRLPFYMLGLMLAVLVILFFVFPALSITLLAGYIPLAVLILWLRSLD